MKIGVIADTHSMPVPEKVMAGLKGVEFIVHAGDFCTCKDYDLFSGFKKVVAVFGNMDEPGLVKKLPEKIIFGFGDFSVGLTHGRGPAKKVLSFVREEFANDKVDAVIFGHSHEPVNTMIGGVLYFNPGSPNDNVVAPFKSYGILEIKGNKLAGKIIKI